MFSLDFCHYPGCQKQALTHFDENGNIATTPGWCLEHTPEPQKTLDEIYDYIKKHDKIVGLNIPGIRFENFDLTDKRFYGCNMQHSTFINIHSEFCRLRMCILDFL